MCGLQQAPGATSAHPAARPGWGLAGAQSPGMGQCALLAVVRPAPPSLHALTLLPAGPAAGVQQPAALEWRLVHLLHAGGLLALEWRLVHLLHAGGLLALEWRLVHLLHAGGLLAGVLLQGRQVGVGLQQGARGGREHAHAHGRANKATGPPAGAGAWLACMAGRLALPRPCARTAGLPNCTRWRTRAPSVPPSCG